MSTSLVTCERNGVSFVEGPAEGELLLKISDWSRVVEACSAAQTRLALLHAANMTPQFFDLSSGEAGEIMQKLRSYRVRVALVCPAATTPFSTRFPELVAEENRLPYFRFFESAEAARDWLVSA